jgi:7-cyano-7-deazaguanine synthase
MQAKPEHLTEKAYILLSGGQDSFVCLIWAIKQFKSVEAVSIAYGQQHEIEIQYAKKIAQHFHIEHTVYNVGDFLKSIAPSSLFEKSDHNKSHNLSEKLPASFVPNRNGLFLTIIANHAFIRGEKRINLVTGTCETDFSGYPDCRDNYIKVKAIELSLSLDLPVNIYTPLMWKSKADTFEMAYNAGKLNELIAMTITCYNGSEQFNAWGLGCGKCPACKLRKNGFEEFNNNGNIRQ